MRKREKSWKVRISPLYCVCFQLVCGMCWHWVWLAVGRKYWWMVKSLRWLPWVCCCCWCWLTITQPTVPPGTLIDRLYCMHKTFMVSLYLLMLTLCCNYYHYYKVVSYPKGFYTYFNRIDKTVIYTLTTLLYFHRPCREHTNTSSGNVQIRVCYTVQVPVHTPAGWPDHPPPLPSAA